MNKCGKGCMPECEYFTTGGCISPFNCMYKIETGYINSATSTPDSLTDLLIEFDEMGFAPTTVCEDAEGLAVKWKEQLVNEIGRLEAKITTLWHKADETKTDAIMQKNRADMLKEKNTNLQEGLKKAVEDVAERIKMAFYYEFDELIPSTMADKIDEIVKEVLNEHEL